MAFAPLYPGEATEHIKVRLPQRLVAAMDARADGPGHRSRLVAQALEAHLA